MNFDDVIKILKEANDNNITLSQEYLTELVASQSLTLNGMNTAVFYSGKINGIDYSVDIANALATQHNDLAFIYKTPLAQILISDEFKESLYITFNYDENEKNKFLYGEQDRVTGQIVKKGLWLIASERFIKENNFEHIKTITA